MTVEQRVLQSLALTPAPTTDPLTAVWRNILLLYPAVAAIVERALSREVDYSAFVQHLLLSGRREGGDDVSDTFIWSALNACFYDRRQRQRRPCVETFQSSHRLSAIDLLVAPLTPPIGSLYDVPPVAFALRARRGSFSDSRDFIDRSRAVMRDLIEPFTALRALDQSCGEQQFALIHDRAQVRLVPFGTWAYCDSPTTTDDVQRPFRGNVVQAAGVFSGDSLGELEDLICANAVEREFQRFFQCHPEYLQVLGPYTTIHPQLVLTEETGSRLIPDFFLENFDTGFCDILDLKRPTERLFKQNRGRPQFRDSVMAGVRQLNQYRDYFEEGDNRRRFEQAYPGLKAFRPRVILIIGRRQNFYDEFDRIRLESELTNWTTLRTYDDVVSTARQWRALIQGTAKQ